MDPELVDGALSSLVETKHMFWQHLSGGEIFLQQGKLFSIIEKIRKYHKKDLGISTNAFWAVNYEKTVKIVDQLIESGITGIAISADYYHQKYMPADGPKILAGIVKEKGLRTHSYLMGARLNDDTQDSKEINAITEQVTSDVNQDLDLPIAMAFERSIGKGSKINMPKKSGIPQGMCTELNTCLGERSPFNPAMVWIDPYGNVMICYGVIIGNLHEKSLNDIIEGYAIDKYPQIKNIALYGPKGLLNEAQQNGLNAEKGFYDECDLCYQSRVALHHKYPEVFGPEECYPK